MVDSIRALEATKTDILEEHEPSSSEEFQRSIYVVKDTKVGDVFDRGNIRILRPWYGLDPRRYEDVIGKKATVDIAYGTPLKEEHIG
jgi:sialic acid synthase SpsE